MNVDELEKIVTSHVSGEKVKFSSLANKMGSIAYVCRRYGRSKAEDILKNSDIGTKADKTTTRIANKIFKDLTNRLHDDKELAKWLGMARRLIFTYKGNVKIEDRQQSQTKIKNKNYRKDYSEGSKKPSKSQYNSASQDATYSPFAKLEKFKFKKK